MNRDEFVRVATECAREASRESGLLVGVTVAQAALESNFGESLLSRDAHNYFGIKAHGKHAAVEYRTTECDAKGEHQVVAKFAAYADMRECFVCRDKLIANGAAYAKAREAKADAEQFARELAKHWATDPRYAEKLLKVYREFGFAELDVRRQTSDVS